MKIKLRTFTILFLTMFLLSFVSADCDWTTYGNSYTPLWNEQLSPTTCWGQFSNLITNKSMSVGMTAGNQSVVANFGTNAYLFFNNGNYLQAYDKDFILRQETNVGYPAMANLVKLDFYNDGLSRDFANLYKINTTDYSIIVHSYNHTANTFTLSYQTNFSGSFLPAIAGLRHNGQTIYFTNTTNLVQVNSTSLKTITIPINQNYSEPVSFYTDYNDNGVRDYMTYNQNTLIIFDENGNHILNKTYGAVLRSARMFKPTASNLWKVATLTEEGSGGGTPTLTLSTFYLDGSSYWSKNIKVGSTSSQHYYGDIAVSDDYDGDSYPDLYVMGYLLHPLNSDIKYLNIYKGSDGTLLFNRNLTYGSLGYTSMKLTIADMNHDGKADFISNMQGTLEVYNPYSATSLFNATSIPTGYCIPSDLNFDGTQDVICSNSTKTMVFFSNYTNQNPTISSVTYDPATTIGLSQPINAIVSAYDVESDTKIYNSKCSDTDSWSSDSASPTQTCIYSIAGYYNLSVGVRDVYHSAYNIFSQTISVTSTGLVCGNGVCETGETSTTCPADCPSIPSSTGSVNGSMNIPLEIVSTTNPNQGLLPEIYYGIIGFLSNTLSPIIILVFVIFFVLIILAIGTIIKRIAEHIGR